jgi:TolA-binding protein
MRCVLPIAIGVCLLLVGAASAQDPSPVPAAPSLPTPAGPPNLPPGGLSEPAPVVPVAPAGQEPDLGTLQQQLEQSTREIVQLKAVQEQAKDPKDTEQLQKQVELLQKQIEVLQKMLKLIAEQVGKQPGGLQTATLEARSKQAAQRDVELANAVDNLTEHVDAQERYGPSLPATLKQLFDPFDNNETPLSIYGSLAFGYSHILGNAATAARGAGRPDTPGGFYFGEFTPDFFLKLNDWILLEAEIGIGSDGSVSAGSFAQADFFVNDWLTIIAGRFVAPIGWYNLRINNPWVNKLPADAPGSVPTLWQQVLPPFAMLGVQAQGSFYLGCSPVKMEYNAYISNGLNVTPATAGKPDINEVTNLENMESTFSNITNDKAIGGRLGLWWPEGGLAGGISGMTNGDYMAGHFEDSISLWALDLNYHKGNWDVRAEYGMTYQHAADFVGKENIRRQGFYAQVAYRPWDCCNKYIQNLEFVYRYGYTDFKGIDPTALDLSTFSTPVDVPVRRHQNEFGINYYFYPRMLLKVAYQINEEPGFHLHDNQFLTELAWGW